MAYIINITDRYPRAQFETDLLGKQLKLVNQSNIRSINGETVLGAGNISIADTGTSDYEYNLSATEQELHDECISKINQIKSLHPLDDLMVFGFISDLHTMPTKEQIQASDASDAVKAAWPDSDVSYWGATAEDNIRLLGSICYDLHADAVFCGGDLSSGRLPYDCYTYMMGKVKGMFDQYISVPHYTVEGNHDRKYNADVALRTNATWLAFLQSFNSNGATYIDNSGVNGYVGNTYYVDFDSHKVRVVMRSQYEKNEASNSSSANGLGCYYKNLYDAMQFGTPTDAADWTIMSFAHYWLDNAGKHFNAFLNGTAVPTGAATDSINLGTYNSGTAGKAVVGELFGHLHSDADVIDSNGKVTSIRVHNAYRSSGADMTSKKSYTLSMYVLDTTSFLLYEVKVGRGWSNAAGAETTPDADAYDSKNDWYLYEIKHN